MTGDIVDTWLKRGEGRPTFCFCVNRRHAQHVAERFVEAGVAAEYMDGATSREDREAIFDRFRSGETRIICNVGVLTTGIDLDVRCIILARPTKSRILFVQTIGRGLRTAEGKDHLLILDHAGNHLRLGMVTDIGQDRLDNGRDRQSARDRARERSKPLPKRCDECSAIVSCTARACPSCGAPIRAKTEVESAEGELVEFGSRRTGSRAPSIADKISFHGELLWIARERGHKPGWVRLQVQGTVRRLAQRSSRSIGHPSSAKPENEKLARLAADRLRQSQGARRQWLRSETQSMAQFACEADRDARKSCTASS